MFGAAAAASRAGKQGSKLRHPPGHRTKNRDASKKRALAALETAIDLQRGKGIIQKYDADGSGQLELADLRKLLEDFNYGKPVSDDEVQFIMQAADTSGDGGISVDEAELLLGIWTTYQKAIPEVDAILLKFDVDGSGKLDRPEVKKMLEELNEGKPVQDCEVDWVIQSAGKLTVGEIAKPEIKRAIRAWYRHVEQKEQSRTCAIL